MTLNSVVLPAPLAPITALRSPAATENETSSTAWSAPKRFETPSSRSASPVERSSRCAGSVIDATASLPLRLGAVRLVARAYLEVLLFHSQHLVDAVHLAQHLVVKVPLRVLHDFGDERRADRLAIAVQFHVTRRRLQRHLLQRLAVLRLAAGQVALDRVQPIQRRLHVDVVDEGEQRRARVAAGRYRIVLLVIGDEGLELRRVISVGDRRAGDGADERIPALALVVQD